MSKGEGWSYSPTTGRNGGGGVDEDDSSEALLRKTRPLSMVYAPTSRIVLSNPLTFPTSTITVAGGPSCRDPIVPTTQKDEHIFARPVTLDTPVPIFATNLSEKSATELASNLDPSNFFRSAPSKIDVLTGKVVEGSSSSSSASSSLAATSAAAHALYSPARKAANSSRIAALNTFIATTSGGTTFSFSSRTKENRERFGQDPHHQEHFLNHHATTLPMSNNTPNPPLPRKSAAFVSSRIIHDPRFNLMSFEAPQPLKMAQQGSSSNSTKGMSGRGGGSGGARFLSDFASTTAMAKESAAAASAETEMWKAVFSAEAKSKARLAALQRATMMIGGVGDEDAEDALGSVREEQQRQQEGIDRNYSSYSSGGGAGVRKTTMVHVSRTVAGSALAVLPSVSFGINHANHVDHDGWRVVGKDGRHLLQQQEGKGIGGINENVGGDSYCGLSPIERFRKENDEMIKSAKERSNHLLVARSRAPMVSDPHTYTRLLPMILDFLTADEIGHIAVFVCKAWYQCIVGSVRLQVRRKLFEPAYFYSESGDGSNECEDNSSGSVNDNNEETVTTGGGGAQHSRKAAGEREADRKSQQPASKQQKSRQKRKSRGGGDSSYHSGPPDPDGRGILFYLGNMFRGDPPRSIRRLCVSDDGRLLYRSRARPSELDQLEIEELRRQGEFLFSSRAREGSASALPETKSFLRLIPAAQLYRNPAEGVAPAVIVMCSRILNPLPPARSLMDKHKAHLVNFSRSYNRVSSSTSSSSFSPSSASRLQTNVVARPQEPPTNTLQPTYFDDLRTTAPENHGSPRRSSFLPTALMPSGLSPVPNTAPTPPPSSPHRLTSSPRQALSSQKLANNSAGGARGSAGSGLTTTTTMMIQRGKLTNFTSFGPSYCVTEDIPFSWIGVDFGQFRVAPIAYTIGTLSIEAMHLEAQSGLGALPVATSTTPPRPPPPATTTPTAAATMQREKSGIVPRRPPWSASSSGGVSAAGGGVRRSTITTDPNVKRESVHGSPTASNIHVGSNSGGVMLSPELLSASPLTAFGGGSPATTTTASVGSRNLRGGDNGASVASSAASPTLLAPSLTLSPTDSSGQALSYRAGHANGPQRPADTHGTKGGGGLRSDVSFTTPPYSSHNVTDKDDKNKDGVVGNKGAPETLARADGGSEGGGLSRGTTRLAPPFPVAWELQGCRYHECGGDVYDSKDWADGCRWHVLDRRDFSRASTALRNGGRRQRSSGGADGDTQNANDAVINDSEDEDYDSGVGHSTSLSDSQQFPFSYPDCLSATFTIDPAVVQRWGYFKRFRIVQITRNSNWGHALAVSGFEIYGSLVLDRREK